MAALAATTPPSATAQLRDSAYYRWRFRNPLSEYRFLFWNDGAPSAFAVLQRSRYLYGADLYLVDYAAPDAEALSAMIGEIVDVGGFDRLSMWTNWLPSSTAAGLHAQGFAPRDMSRGSPGFQPGFLAIDLGNASASASSSWPHSWDLRMIDSDAY